jgi:hypothetical protein
MRLTLRTLLAYLDDLLEPADAQDLKHKIDESEFASTIVNRINDCMRRLRLGVPPLNGRGMGGDPNTVAEYLDNTMAPDLVPEFERLCLESDVHLAEVAACHQILTLVLGEPAEVDPASRQRMYRLIQEPAQPADNSAPPPPDQPRRRPQIPEYLREPELRNYWLKITSIGAVAACLLLLAIVIFWPRASAPVAQAPTSAPAASRPRPPAIADQPAAAEQPAPATRDQTPSATASPASQPSTQTPTSDKPPGHEAPAGTAPKASETMVPATAIEAAPSQPAATAVKVPNEAESAAAPKQAPPATDQPPSVPAPPEARPEPATGGAVGRYVSEGRVLVRFQPPDEWLRLPARDPLSVGERIVSLPDFQGTISLNSGVTAQLLGGTGVTFQFAEGSTVPEIDIDFGKVMLLSSANPDAKVRVRVGGQSGTLTLSDPSSVAGLEVVPVLAPGADPATSAGVRQTVLYIAKATVIWQGPGAATPTTLAAPARLSWAGEQLPPPKPEDLPIWLTSETQLSEIDRRAADFIAGAVGTDRSARLALTELTTHRRFEVKALAVRSLGLLDNFEPLVLALGDATQRSAWAEHIQVLRESLARGPEVAARVRQAFERRRADHAAELYRMLWGYTEEQLRQGAASELVGNLDHPDLDMRVLAIWNLEQITGEPSRYRPHDPPNLRQPQMRRWRLWLQKYEPTGR